MKAPMMRRVYLTEAIVALALARLMLMALPYAWIFSWANKDRQRRSRRFTEGIVPWISWSIDTVAAYRWMNAICLPKALAAQMMLRRRNVASRLCLGVARKSGALVAHAWLELDGEVIVGGNGVEGFTKIAEFGAKQAEVRP